MKVIAAIKQRNEWFNHSQKLIFVLVETQFDHSFSEYDDLVSEQVFLLVKGPHDSVLVLEVLHHELFKLQQLRVYSDVWTALLNADLVVLVRNVHVSPKPG